MRKLRDEFPSLGIRNPEGEDGETLRKGAWALKGRFGEERAGTVIDMALDCKRFW